MDKNKPSKYKNLAFAPMFAKFKVSKCWRFIIVTISGNGLFPGPIKASQLAQASVLEKTKTMFLFLLSHKLVN